MIGPSGLAPLALHQLAAWQQLGREWPIKADFREGTEGAHWYMSCYQCNYAIYQLTDESGSFQVTPQMILDLTVLHLRQRHADMEPAGL